MAITTSMISQETVIDKLASLIFQANKRTQSGIEHESVSTMLYMYTEQHTRLIKKKKSFVRSLIGIGFVKPLC